MNKTKTRNVFYNKATKKWGTKLEESLKDKRTEWFANRNWERASYLHLLNKHKVPANIIVDLD